MQIGGFFMVPSVANLKTPAHTLAASASAICTLDNSPGPRGFSR